MAAVEIDWDRAAQIAQGHAAVHQLSLRLEATEDFGRFTAHGCGALFGLGAGLDQPALHSPKYDFPDELIPSGVRLFVRVLESCLTLETGH